MPPRPLRRTLLLAALLLAPAARAGADDGTPGYYRDPALHGHTLVFTAEGDLWRVGDEGGLAQRLTSHAGEESHAAISPDGRRVAFSAAYDGPVEVYVMPIEGGLPRRLTWEGGRAVVAGWTPQGRVLYATRRYSTLPETQLRSVDPASGVSTPVPLAQAAEGAYAGPTLIFTRLDFQGSHTRRYRGGTVQQLWAWPGGAAEAQRLFPGDSATSRTPMIWQNRVYFVGDRDLAMNLWSANLDGSDARPLTHHRQWDVQGASLSDGHIAYQLGADLRLFDIATGADRVIPIRLQSDLDQERERWVKDPLSYASAIHLSPDGDRLAITARGQVFVLPVREGRTVAVTHADSVRNRQARFMPDGRTLVALSDASGEVELWRLPANGVGAPQPLTHDGTVLRWDALPSPDGKWIAHTNKNQELWLLEVASGRDTRIAVSDYWADITGLAWSPDSRWLAFVRPAPDLLTQILLYGVATRTTTTLTDDRWDSYSPTFSPDGKWLWFLSDRTFHSLVPSIWGSRQPDPFFDRSTGIYGLALQKSFRSPFEPPDELHPEAKEAEEGPKGKGGKAAAAVAPLELDGLPQRLVQVPAGTGNFSDLATDGKQLYVLDAATTLAHERSLEAIAIAPEKHEPQTVLAGVTAYELSANGRKLLVRTGDALHVFDAGPKPPADLASTTVSLKDWTFTVDPRIEWTQMFREGWRLERDYFYDRHMNGVDWPAMLARYRPLAERVTDRNELNDLFGQMIGELSALHMFVRGGDARRGDDQALPASLGADLERDAAAGGWRIARIYRTDPDLPDDRSPLAAPGLDVREGDVVRAVNGTPTLSVSDPAALLRQQAGRQVLLGIGRAGAAPRDVIVRPLAPGRDADLRYSAWEYACRQRVDSLGAGRIGYLHLRAMGPDDIARWERDYYPVFDRDGLVIDVRNNSGGNIDAWILGKLLRRVWFYWQPRVGHPEGNMPFAFLGHVVVLVNERTSSDGEAFAEGFRRLGLGRVIGTRTWGGEIWLSSDNFLVDHGIATAAEVGVYGPEGTWLIEGHGVDPDIRVDDLPRATYAGADAQLDAAVRELQAEIRAQPVVHPGPPAYPDKSGPR